MTLPAYVSGSCAAACRLQHDLALKPGFDWGCIQAASGRPAAAAAALQTCLGGVRVVCEYDVAYEPQG